MNLMKHPFKIFFATVFLVSAITAAVGSSFKSDVIDNVSAQISKGNAGGVATYFNDNVDVSIIDKQGVYSKAQAQIVLQNFFSTNAVKSFSIVQRGQTSDGMFCIGTYVSSNASYRIYYLVSYMNGINLIVKFSISKQ